MIRIKKVNIIFKITLLIFFKYNYLHANFFRDISHLIEGNSARLSYGIAVTDIDNDDAFDFIVTGYRYPNLALSFKNN